MNTISRTATAVLSVPAQQFKDTLTLLKGHDTPTPLVFSILGIDCVYLPEGAETQIRGKGSEKSLVLNTAEGGQEERPLSRWQVGSFENEGFTVYLLRREG